MGDEYCLTEEEQSASSESDDENRYIESQVEVTGMTGQDGQIDYNAFHHDDNSKLGDDTVTGTCRNNNRTNCASRSESFASLTTSTSQGTESEQYEFLRCAGGTGLKVGCEGPLRSKLDESCDNANSLAVPSSHNHSISTQRLDSTSHHEQGVLGHETVCGECLGVSGIDSRNNADQDSVGPYSIQVGSECGRDRLDFLAVALSSIFAGNADKRGTRSDSSLLCNTPISLPLKDLDNDIGGTVMQLLPGQLDNIAVALSSSITEGNVVRREELNVIDNPSVDNRPFTEQSVELNELVPGDEDSIDVTSERNIFGTKQIKNDSARWVVFNSYLPSEFEESGGEMFGDELRNTHLSSSAHSLTLQGNDWNLSGNSNLEDAEETADLTLYESGAVCAGHAVSSCDDERGDELHHARVEGTSNNDELPVDVDDNNEQKLPQLGKKEKLVEVEDQPSEETYEESHISVPQAFQCTSGPISLHVPESRADRPAALCHELQMTKKRDLHSHELLFTLNPEVVTNDCDQEFLFCQDASSSCDTSSDSARNSSILPTFFDTSKPSGSFVDSRIKTDETLPEFDESVQDISNEGQDQGSADQDNAGSNSKLSDSFKAKFKCVQLNADAGNAFDTQLPHLLPCFETVIESTGISPVSMADNDSINNQSVKNQSVSQSSGKNVGFCQGAILGNSARPLVGVRANSLQESENGDKMKCVLPSPSKLVIRSQGRDTVRKVVSKLVQDNPTPKLPAHTSGKASPGSETASVKTRTLQESSREVVSSSTTGSIYKSGPPTKGKVSFDKFQLSAYRRAHRLMLSKVAKVVPEPRAKKKTGTGKQTQKKAVIREKVTEVSDKVQKRTVVSVQSLNRTSFDKAQKRPDIEICDKVQQITEVCDKALETNKVCELSQEMTSFDDGARKRTCGEVQKKTEVCNEIQKD